MNDHGFEDKQTPNFEDEGEKPVPTYKEGTERRLTPEESRIEAQRYAEIEDRLMIKIKSLPPNDGGSDPAHILDINRDPYGRWIEAVASKMMHGLGSGTVALEENNVYLPKEAARYGVNTNRKLVLEMYLGPPDPEVEAFLRDSGQRCETIYYFDSKGNWARILMVPDMNQPENVRFKSRPYEFRRDTRSLGVTEVEFIGYTLAKLNERLDAKKLT
ncbi:hypothetical protein HYW43_01385 [Candidatus Daviesbacteria bacterium]|nr:hypothetical protein [Candidatus Daviesbacteria bacterium]